MSAANRRRGSQFERDVLSYLRTEGYDAERLRLASTKDEGDLVLKVGGLAYVLELKNKKQLDLAGAVREAEREARNYSGARKLGFVVNFAALIKKRNAGIGEAYVVIPLHEYLKQISPPF